MPPAPPAPGPDAPRPGRRPCRPDRAFPQRSGRRPGRCRARAPAAVLHNSTKIHRSRPRLSTWRLIVLVTVSLLLAAACLAPPPASYWATEDAPLRRALRRCLASLPAHRVAELAAAAGALLGL
jgi:hypothetical protein